ALAAVDFLERHPERGRRLHENAKHFREGLLGLGFKPHPSQTPIIPGSAGETALAIRLSEGLLSEGGSGTGLGLPVVPQARVRCQISAAHTKDDLDAALAAFRKVGTKLGLI